MLFRSLWSDHGWHLGEKQHWQKYTAWRACTRVPFILRVPKNTPGLQSGTVPARCDKPVNLLSVFPTLLELTGLPAELHHDGSSLVPLLRDPSSNWDHVSTTYLADPGSFGISDERWRYIHYANGEEELYDIQSDPYEWNNLASKPEHASHLSELQSKSPKEFALKPAPSLASLPKLRWHSTADQEVPSSKPVGNPFEVIFLNETPGTLKLFWVSPDGQRKSYGDIEPGNHVRQQTRPGAVWLITNKNEKQLGYFVVDDRTSKAIIPKD